jgi:hypothetical protein
MAFNKDTIADILSIIEDRVSIDLSESKYLDMCSALKFLHQSIDKNNINKNQDTIDTNNYNININNPNNLTNIQYERVTSMRNSLLVTCHQLETQICNASLPPIVSNSHKKKVLFKLFPNDIITDNIDYHVNIAIEKQLIDSIDVFENMAYNLAITQQCEFITNYGKILSQVKNRINSMNRTLGVN